MGKASKADLEKAFTAGFHDKDIELDPSAELDDDEDTVAEQIAAESNKDLEKPEVKDKDEVDEWAGYTPEMKERFQAMETNLTKFQNIANSASGRVNKLQGELDRQKNDEPEVKPKITSDELLAAMTNKDSRDKLREEFGEFAAALDEIDQSVSTSVGSAIDNLRIELRAEAKNINESSMQELENKRALDIKHPGWETTVQNAEFKKWVYEGGPSEQESQYYDSLLFQAQQAAPNDTAALQATATRYYTTLVEQHPIWADKKGSLYGAESGESAISLLDLYKKDKAPVVNDREERLSDNRFEENLTPTSGQNRRAVEAPAEDIEKAFSEGFNS